MAVTYFPKTKFPKITAKPVTPFSSKNEKECSSCLHFIENIDLANTLGYCSIHKEPTNKYDECSAFVKSLE